MRLKVNYKILLVATCLTILTKGLNAQSELDHHKKYWFYKSRLNNDFIKVGNTATGSTYAINDGHGESIPLNERHALSGTNNLAYPVKSGVDLSGGDGPTQLGIYLSVLATEYKLLKGNQQDLTRVKHEIFCALNAINRLDYHAEPSLDNTKSANLNGFFIRDDIPVGDKGFVMDNYEHFNYFHNRMIYDPSNPNIHDSTLVRGFCQSYDGQITRSNGKYPTVASEPSQDHYYYLLMGLTLTSKLVDFQDTDGSNVFGYGSGESKLAQEAVNIAERLIKYLKTNQLWIIQNPNTNSNISGQGAYATPYAYALDNLGCFIKHNQSLPFVHVPGITGGISYPYALSWDFRNLHSLSPLAVSTWQVLATGAGGGLTVDQVGFFQILAGAGANIYESQIYLNTVVQAAISALQAMINNIYAALGQSIQTILNNLPNWVPQWLQTATQTAITVLQQATQTAVNTFNAAIQVQMQYLNPTILTNTTDARLYMNSTLSQIAYFNNCTGPSSPINHQGSDLYFGIYLRDILHGYNQSLPSYLAFITAQPGFSHLVIKNTVKGILDSAPCEGNYHYGLGPNGGYPGGSHWGGPNFIDRIDRVWNKAYCPEFRGDYSGLDYLLMHNLYYLTEGATGFEDYIDRTEATNYPNGLSFFSGNSVTMTKGAFEYLRPANAIGPYGAAIFRAGKDIVPVPGAFSVAQGAEVGFDPTPYYCSGLNDASMNRSSNSPVSADPFANGHSKPVVYLAPPPPSRQNTIKDNSLDQFQTVLEEQKNKINEELNKTLDIIKEYNKIEIYPNPNAGKFVIDFKLDNEDNVNVQIVDMLGNVVLTENHVTGTLVLPVNMERVAKGIYLVKITSSDKEEIRKISIQ